MHTVGRGGFSVSASNTYGWTYGYARVLGSYGRNFITDGFRSTDDATGIRAAQTFVLNPRLLVEVGTDDRHYGGEAHSQPGPHSYGTHHINEQSGFSRVQWAAARRLRLHAGYRYQANSQFGDLSIPEAGASFSFTERYSIAFDASRGFRNPTLRELYLFPRAESKPSAGKPCGTTRRVFTRGYHAAFGPGPACTMRVCGI